MALTKEYLLAIKSFEGIGTVKLLKIGNYVEDKNIAISSPSDLVPILDDLKIKVKKEKVTTEMLQKALGVARRTIEYNLQAGIGITTYYDEDYPKILRDTISEDGKIAPPMVLYYKGDLSITRMPGLAVIGTREITDFGKKAGLYLTQEFAKRGFCIVSGLAIGCDTVGHRGALDVGGKTIAFLAHGLDSVYPPENEVLAQQIVDNGGLLLSEYPVGMGVNRYNLVARDRLQASMSLATLVIQTGVQGGTMHAANTTLQYPKPLYVIKFKNNEENEHEKSLGNALLVEKGAKYISGGDDIDAIAESILNYQKPKTTLFD